MSRRSAVMILCGLALAALAASPQPAMVPVPSTLEVEGIPAIPAQLASDVGRYGAFRQTVFAAWHPTERRMLVNARAGDTFQIHSVAAPLGELRQVTFEDGSVGAASPGNGNAWFDGGGRAIVFRRDDRGNQRFQLHRKAADAERASTVLTDGKSRHGLPVWSPDRRRIAYYSTRRNGRDRDIWVMSLDSPADARLVGEVQGVWEPLAWSPDGAFILAMEIVSRARTRLWEIEIATGARTELLPDLQVAYGAAEYSADGRAVYVTSDAWGEYREFGVVQKGSSRLTRLAAKIRWDVEDMVMSPDRRWIALVANEAGVGTLYVFDTRSRALTRVEGLAGRSVQGIGWHANSEDLAFNATSVKLPWNVFSYNIRTRMVQEWTRPETGDLAPADFADARLITWRAFDGLQISGFLYTPPRRFTGARPVIINIHGGPEAQERPRFLGRSNYLLDELGVAIIYPNIRGSTGFGKTFLTLDNGARREDAVKDIGALLDWIATQPTLDGRRVSLAGASYGGYIALAAAATYPDRIRCVFDGFGMSHLGTFLDRLDPGTRVVRRPEYGDETDPAARAIMEKTAPLTHAGRIRAPVFILHGRNDPSVPVEESKQMVSAVKAHGGRVWAMYATNAGHGFADSRPNDEYSFYAWVLFLREYLLPERTPPSTG